MRVYAPRWIRIALHTLERIFVQLLERRRAAHGKRRQAAFNESKIGSAQSDHKVTSCDETTAADKNPRAEVQGLSASDEVTNAKDDRVHRSVIRDNERSKRIADDQRRRPRPAPVSTNSAQALAERVSTRSPKVLIVTGGFIAAAIFFATWALVDILPRTPFALELVSYLGVAGAFFFWWVYGDKLENLRHVLVGSVNGWSLCLGSIVVLLCALYARWYWSPEQLLKRALLGQAAQTELIQGEHSAERVLDHGRLPGWQIRYYHAREPNSSGQILLTQDVASDAVEFQGAEPTARPMLLLAEPAVRKRPFLLSLRRTLATNQVPSALVTIRECYARNEKTVESCLLTELSALFKEPEIRVRPHTSELLDTFDSARGWWLLIDGVDDSGSAADIVRLIREATHLARQHGQRLVISSRRNLLEYVVEKTLSDDLASFVRSSWIVTVDGLNAEGFKRRRDELEKRTGNPGERARAGFAALDKAASNVTTAELVKSIERMALLVDGIGQLDGPAAVDDKAPCVIADWARTRQFEAHCLGELCGNDERKAAIERTWRQITIWLETLDEKKERVTLQELDDQIAEINKNPAVGRDAILYALLGTSVLDPISRDQFKTNHDWTLVRNCH